MLTALKIRNFRCFEALDCEFEPGLNVFCGSNAQGKTSLLEAVCVLLRLQSPRVGSLAYAIMHSKRGFVLDGHCSGFHLQFYLSPERKKLALDSVAQSNAQEYLQVARLVYFSNQDIELVRGSGAERRKFMDFVAAQVDPVYRKELRNYEKALRSRNLLLKQQARWREIAAFDEPLVDAGNKVAQVRGRLVEMLWPKAAAAQKNVSGTGEELALEYLRGCGENFQSALAQSREEDVRLRQTTVGPHRDDLGLLLNGRISGFASEGQQRTMALSLKIAQAHLLQEQSGKPPLLLLDDIFGELDPQRRNALMGFLPEESQRLVTTTNVDWMETRTGVRRIQQGRLGPWESVD